VDVIFNSGNGLCEVDDPFEHAVEREVLGRPGEAGPGSRR